MNGRERILTTLNHQEPDCVPLDVGATQVTGIHHAAYSSLHKALALPGAEATLCDAIQGLALPADDFIVKLGVDVRGLFPRNSHNWNIVEERQGDNWIYRDEWGITHRKPWPDGFYYDVWQVPLGQAELAKSDIDSHPWPDFSDPKRIEGLRELAEAYRAQGYAVLIKDPFAGVFEMSQRIVGMENLLMMMAVDETMSARLFDKLTELKLAFWEMALPRLGDVIDLISHADDYGTQTSQLISPRMYRQQIKPHWARIFKRVQELTPHARRFFHSCGNVRPLIPDFIEIGVEILNPVQTNAVGMDPVELKRDFGKDIAFWGGGIDTQATLPNGTPQQVHDEVKRNMEIFAPGGGYVFNTIHNIQADVPVENMVAMFEAFQRYREYT